MTLKEPSYQENDGTSRDTITMHIDNQCNTFFDPKLEALLPLTDPADLGSHISCCMFMSSPAGMKRDESDRIDGSEESINNLSEDTSQETVESSKNTTPETKRSVKKRIKKTNKGENGEMTTDDSITQERENVDPIYNIIKPDEPMENEIVKQKISDEDDSDMFGSTTLVPASDEIKFKAKESNYSPTELQICRTDGFLNLFHEELNSASSLAQLEQKLKTQLEALEKRVMSLQPDITDTIESLTRMATFGRALQELADIERKHGDLLNKDSSNSGECDISKLKSDLQRTLDYKNALIKMNAKNKHSKYAFVTDVELEKILSERRLNVSKLSNNVQQLMSEVKFLQVKNTTLDKRIELMSGTKRPLQMHNNLLNKEGAAPRNALAKESVMRENLAKQHYLKSSFA